MARPNWAPPRKAGESEASYKKRYYTAQRVHAEKTGDTKTTSAIQSKLPKAAPKTTRRPDVFGMGAVDDAIGSAFKGGALKTYGGKPAQERADYVKSGRGTDWGKVAKAAKDDLTLKKYSTKTPAQERAEYVAQGKTKKVASR